MEEKNPASVSGLLVSMYSSQHITHSTHTPNIVRMFLSTSHLCQSKSVTVPHTKESTFCSVLKVLVYDRSAPGYLAIIIVFVTK